MIPPTNNQNITGFGEANPPRCGICYSLGNCTHSGVQSRKGSDSIGNPSIESDLAELPDKVADALKDWRTMTLDRERVEALLYAHFKAEGEKTATDIKAQINAHPERYQACLNEIVAESAYNRLYEKLMSAKKLASLRAAF